MKKISLKDMKNGLSRNEMKKINGGGYKCTNDGRTEMDYCCKTFLGIKYSCDWV